MSFRRQQLLGWVVAGSVLFVVLTLVAMWFYPGGTVGDPDTVGYSFFRNFFSDLGRTASRLGTPNTVSAILFFVALTLAGLTLILFFAIMPSFLWRSRAARVPALSGTFFGAGASFGAAAASGSGAPHAAPSAPAAAIDCSSSLLFICFSFSRRYQNVVRSLRLNTEAWSLSGSRAGLMIEL